jgi:hypothetical protein
MVAYIEVLRTMLRRFDFVDPPAPLIGTLVGPGINRGEPQFEGRGRTLALRAGDDKSDPGRALPPNLALTCPAVGAQVN